MNPDNVRLILEIAGVVFAVGAIYGELKAIRKDISRLEEKQTKYNNLQERVLRNELKIENFDKAIKELKERL